ncbi:MAG TPA: DUF5317 domain-containing protein [bacterium]|nr:DUF5317 domain-containing protein [bacterium]
MVIGWARGGRTGALERTSLRALPLLGAAVLLVLLARLPVLAPDAARGVGAAAYLAALGFLWQNRAQPWMLVVFLGLALNSLAMFLNGGRMPVSGEALARAGHLGNPGGHGGLGWRYVLAGPGTRMAPLGDTLPVRVGSAGVVVSPGDLLMALGIAGFVQGRMRAAPPA